MSEAGANSGPRYMPQLDALRVFAVSAVLVHHFMDLNQFPGFLGKVNWGILGVRLFFVLSGFLITGILARARTASEATAAGRRFALRQFYVRRFLRIFPLYYGVIAVALVLNVGSARLLAGWLLSYTPNIYIAWHGEWIGAFSHFWSLAIEEQYYLVWPLVVLFAPRRFVVAAAVSLIAIGPLYRMWAVSRGINVLALRCFTLSAVDTLGAGSLLALGVEAGIPARIIQSVLGRTLLPAGIAGMIACEYFLISGHHGALGAVALDSAVSVVFAWLVFRASTGFSGLGGAVLGWKPLASVGRITYGIYVYHFFLPVAYAYVFPILGQAPPAKGMFNLLLSAAISVLVAALSWRFFESPVNGLKRFFEYDKSREERRRPVAA